MRRDKRSPTLITITNAQRRFASWMTDVLVYTVVLNLFVEWVPGVEIESFTISIFTAVVLKLLLDLILHYEHVTSAWFDRREGAAWRVLDAVATLGILFLSKFVILEVIDIVFGDEVDLGYIFEVILLVVALIVAQRTFGWIYQRLGRGIAGDAPLD